MANQLKKEEETELREIFKIYDNDGDGLINDSELGSILKTQDATFDKEQLSALVTEYGKTTPGKMSVEDFLELRRLQVKDRTSEEELMGAFAVFDKKRTGLISKDLLKQALLNYAEGVSEKDAEELLSIAKVDEKNQINIKDFVVLLLGADAPLNGALGADAPLSAVE